MYDWSEYSLRVNKFSLYKAIFVRLALDGWRLQGMELYKSGPNTAIRYTLITLLLLQIYTGRYRPPTERENPVLASDDFLDTIEMGSLVAVNLSNYDKIPVIGKVFRINSETVKIHYWKGSFKGKFSPQNLPRSRTPWVEELPKSCIILRSFSLTDEDRLLPSSRKHLPTEYAKLKNVQ